MGCTARQCSGGRMGGALVARVESVTLGPLTMTTRGRDTGSLRLLVLCAVGSLLLSSCSLFHPEKVSIASRVTQTLPPQPLGTGAINPTVAPGSGPQTIFVPGKTGIAGGKPNYASAPGVTANAIRIGIIVPMDGPAAQLGK